MVLKLLADFEAGKIVAIGKGILTYSCHSGVHAEAGHAIAVVESLVADSHSVRNVNTGRGVAVLEGTFTNGLKEETTTD